jgi:hypothetical protein
MKRRFLPCLLLALAAPAHAQPMNQAFGWFAGLADSCWVGRFPDGKTEHTQCYSVQFQKFLRGTAALKVQREGQWQLIFEGDSLFAWDESKSAIVNYIWGSDGSHRQFEARYVGEELHLPVPARADANKIAYRSVWRRLSSDTFEVRRERPNEAEWSTELAVVYRRTEGVK